MSHSTSSSSSFKSLNWQDNEINLHKMGEFSVVTFNMLAPCYKRLEERDLLGRNRREADMGWQDRANETLAFFEGELLKNFQVVSLQEFWLNEDYHQQFKRLVSRLGFSLYTLRRHATRKEDAVAIMVQTSELRVKSYENVFLCSASDRVALVMWLEHKETKKNVIVANTHLSFPHTAKDVVNQKIQMEQLLLAMDAFATAKCGCPDASRIVMGDFNVEGSSEVCDMLRARGYHSSVDVSPPPIVAGDNKSSSEFVSHRTHRHEDLGVDHIFVKPEAFVEESKKGSFFASDTRVLPDSAPSTAWDEEFSISDHRPVGAKVVIGVSW